MAWGSKHGTARLVGHGAAGWAACGAAVATTEQLAGVPAALIAHSFLTPAVFAVVAWNYFRSPRASDPLPTAVAWTAIVVVLDLAAVAGGVYGAEIFASIAGMWLPLAFGFAAAWATGALVTTRPWPKTSGRTPPAHGRGTGR